MFDTIATAAGPSPSRILRPGVWSLPPGMERYVVPAGGALMIEIEPGDTITLTDMEGGQACELVTADASGAIDTGMLNERPSNDAAGLKAYLASDDTTHQRLKKALARRKIDVAKATAVRVFGQHSHPHDRAEFNVQRGGVLLACAPGEAMDFDLQNTSTPILLMLQRARLLPANETRLPEPLGDMVDEFRINASTARSYTVAVGQFIQIIDVAGRQCSDFQCFSRRKLDEGRELPLDATITRTYTHAACPAPGAFSRLFDLELDPLVSTFQDSCSRHDAFTTACNERYYNDMGYPGHVNCSENFNQALAPYGITPRYAWEAHNYFYNTNYDDHEQLWIDEPWSRPGDYVLLHAQTDLVCVSSACPDDIDAANGWDPTDIHIRIYSAKENFPKSVAFRMTPDAQPQMTRQTGFHEGFARHTRNFVEYNGFWLANNFNHGCATEDYWACRERAVIMDLSPLRKFEVLGPDAEALLQYCMTRNVSKLAAGHVVYTAMCYEHGGMIDDGTLFRLDTNNFRWIGGSDYSGIWLREQAEKLGLEVWVRSSTDQLHNIAVQGPKSREILKDLIWTPANRTALMELEWFRFTSARIGHFNGAPVVVSRTGYTGELGYEIFCHPKDAMAVFDAVWEAGEPFGMRPLGLEALDMVRIEAGLVFAGYEFSDETDPFEAGIGFTVPLKSKAEDFIGKTALIERKAHPQKKLVGLEIDSREAVGHGDCVHIGRAQIGVVTSGMRSPLLQKNIALARLDAIHSEIGTEVEIGKLDGHMKRLPARVVRFAHYDPDKKKPRS